MGISKLAAVAVFLSAQGALASPAFPGQYKARAQQLLTAYDYVVVGGGASGLTVANRLSENPDVTVLVIEAGVLDANEDFVTIPGLAGGAVGTKYDWNLTYVASDSLGGRNVSIPQGKVVGGSTKLNRMVFDRGSKSDYDRWATLGNDGWNWSALLPYFKKNEKFTPATAAIAAEYNITYDAAAHGTSGYMHSTYSPFFWPTTKNMVGALKELKIPIAKDQANGSPIGGYFCPHNQDPVTETRSSAREAYYNNFTKRQNLHLLTGQQVTRIVTQKISGAVKVTDVEYAASKNGARQTVCVKKEAILAAGSIHTPQILQVSGIGNPATLSSINVTTVVDLPAVGQNLQDHVLLAVVNVITAPLTSSNLTSNATFAAEARAQYDNQRQGPYTSPTGDFLAFLPLSTYSKNSTSIHAQAVAQDGTTFLPAGTPAEVVKGYRKQQSVLNDKLPKSDSAILEAIWADGVFVLGLQHPYSRGSVKASSANIFDAPIADAGLLRNPLDVKILAEGVRFTRTLTATSAIGSLQPFEVVPGASVASDSDLEQFIRSSASTLFHPAGSCKMGKREEGGVVDGKLKVYGVQGLRIVDASVMPLLPASHTMTTVYAVAERDLECPLGT
ncbi:GMC oxidoreductase [Ilyonectria robusta]